MFSSVERERSVSSIRRMKVPRWWRARSQLKSAVRAPPTWRWPVGLGAKRTRTGPGIGVHFTPTGWKGGAPGVAATPLGSEFQTADHEVGERADDEHDPAPDARRIDDTLGCG